jgi:hypothetical protein
MTYSEERSLEQRYRSAVAGLYARLRSNYDFLYEKYGDEGLQIIADMSRSYGLEVAGRAKARMKDRGIKSVGEYLLRIFNTVDAKEGLTAVAEWGENKVIIKANECPLHFDKCEVCLAHTTMEKTVVEELNPNLTYRIGKSIPAGDPYCEHIVEVKPVQPGNKKTTEVV